MAAQQEPFKPPPHEIGNFVAYLLAILVGALGPVLARSARDDEMFVFGLSLFAFAAAFLFAELKRHYDIADAVRDARTASLQAGGAP